MTAEFFNFSKKNNSTARPTEKGVEKAIHLKNNVSLTTPIITLNASFTEIAKFNYCSMLNGFYFISDKVNISNDVWQLNLEIDLLGTYKNDILSSEFFVEYAESGYNTLVNDTRFVPLENSGKSISEISLANMDLQNGNFILTVANNVNIASMGGFTTAYAISPTQLAKFAEDFINKGNIKDVFSDKFNNPYDAIISCYWIPFSLAVYPASTHAVKLGELEFDAVAQYVTNPTYTYTSELPIKWKYADFRRRWEKISLFLPCVGLVDLPIEKLLSSSSIYIKVTYDLFDGKINYIISRDYSLGDSDGIIATYSGDSGAEIAIAQTRGKTDKQSLIFSALNETVGVYGTSKGAAEYSTRGSIAGRSSFYAFKKMQLIVTSPDTQTNGIENIIGRAVMQKRNMSKMTGYVKTNNASIKANCSNLYRDRINTLLDGGIFIE